MSQFNNSGLAILHSLMPGYQLPESALSQLRPNALQSAEKAESGARTPPTTFSLPCKVIYSKKSSDVSFTLRQLSPSHFDNVTTLKEEISRQSKNATIDINGDVGYFDKVQKWLFQSKEDLNEVVRIIEGGKPCTLWVQGLEVVDVMRRKRTARPGVNTRSEQLFNYNGSDSELEEEAVPVISKKKKKTALEIKNERVEEIIKKLIGTHKDKYTKIQYRLWAEMLDVGTHTSYTECPPVPIFNQKRSKSTSSSLTEAITDIAESISVALGKNSKSRGDMSVCSSSSPFKTVDVQSKYLQQLKELHSLFEAGGITENEYLELKAPILDNMKTLMATRK
jgi:hypothetical protein